MEELVLTIEKELLTTEVQQFADEAQKCIDLYSKKNHDYGNFFDKGMDNIGYSYGIGRIYDKVNRLITLSKFDAIKRIAVVDENIDDTLRDLACYAMMMLAYRKRECEKEQSKINLE